MTLEVSEFGILVFLLLLNLFILIGGMTFIMFLICTPPSDRKENLK